MTCWVFPEFRWENRPELGDVDLCKVAKSIVEELSWEAQEKGIVLRATCSEAGVPSVTGDLSKLRDSIMNLVDNAIRYTDKGSVEVSVVSEGNDILVRVADTGAGIDPAEAKGLFKSFRRGDVGRKKWVEGSGLGLYIAQEFIALHRGKIWAESKGKGQGSRSTSGFLCEDGPRRLRSVGQRQSFRGRAAPVLRRPR
jgi:signal transduction histidine kinase